MAPIQRILKRFRPVSIRNRLLIAFLMMVLIPTIVFGAVSAWIGVKNGRQQVIDQLTSIVVLKEVEIGTWVRSIQSDLAIAIRGQDTKAWIHTLLSSPGDSTEFQKANYFLFDNLSQLLGEALRLDEIFVVNMDRRIVFSTNREHEGSLDVGISGVGSRAYLIFLEGLQGEYSDLSALTRIYQDFVVLIVRSIYDENGDLLGLVVGHAGSDKLSNIMLERAGLGETGETFLVNSNGIILTTSRYEIGQGDAVFNVSSSGSKYVLYDHINGFGVYRNYKNDRVIGVYHWLPELQVALIAEQTESEAMQPVYQMVKVNIGVALAAALIAGITSVLIAQTIVRPLDSLAQTAKRVTDGELGLNVPVEYDDEIGALARAFNTMTSRLQGVIGNLEQRVKERTEILRKRAVQLETSAQVGHEITSILDVERLIDRVTSLIAKTFGYYHVGIYLLDRKTNKLSFRSGAGEVGRPALAQGNWLEYDLDSLNIEAVRSNQTIVVNDVSTDPRYYFNKNLPKTQSELVVPLKVGERIIGTLDVQSTQIDAFSEDDARIIQGLGDQVAVAIENARLYEQSRTLATLEERNRLARDLHDSVTQSLYSLTLMVAGWQRMNRVGELSDIEQPLIEMRAVAEQALKEMRFLLYELRPPALESEGFLGALHQRLGAVEKRAGVEVRLVVDEIVELNETAEEELYLIAMEALNNALKHAGATSITVNFRVIDDQVELEIADDGQGFDCHGKSRGVGLASMQERAQKLGGSLMIHSFLGKGTSVKVILPVDSNLKDNV
ncbi:MAG: GAF domain-containing protein [Anaerolineales bacterium]|nr:GAF domain-containing protein [Anaerolineales bacterium]